MLENPLLEAFLEELIVKCDFAEVALIRMQDIAGARGRMRSALLFEALMSYLHHTASVSLVLWPSGLSKNKRISAMDRRMRGLELRLLLGVSNTSILSERKFRDHIAHMDERLEDWWIESVGKNKGRFLLGDLSSLASLTQLEQKEMFEVFDPVLFLFIFRGETLSILESFAEIQRIRTSAIRKRGANLSMFG